MYGKNGAKRKKNIGGYFFKQGVKIACPLHPSFMNKIRKIDKKETHAKL